MKYFVISDIHGDIEKLKLALKRFEESSSDKLICLGDVYYHGPRNPLPEGYNPMEVSKLLNDIKDSIIVVKGNCDAEVDQMISDFTYKNRHTIKINDKLNILCHHGHKPLPKGCFDAILSGHTHIGRLEKENNVIYANPGSISLPKAENSQGYLLLDSDGIKHFDLLTNVLIKEINF
jgi:putative phosphoesterase